LAVKCQAFKVGQEAEEIRVLWKMTHQKALLDEDWLSTLLSERYSPPPHAIPTHVEGTAEGPMQVQIQVTMLSAMEQKSVMHITVPLVERPEDLWNTRDLTEACQADGNQAEGRPSLLARVLDPTFWVLRI
jgi:hypothetical protein